MCRTNPAHRRRRGVAGHATVLLAAGLLVGCAGRDRNDDGPIVVAAHSREECPESGNRVRNRDGEVQEGDTSTEIGASLPSGCQTDDGAPPGSKREEPSGLERALDEAARAFGFLCLMVGTVLLGVALAM